MVETKKILNTYIYDFLIKSSLDETAQLFKHEADVTDVKPDMDAPQGFLYEWWQIFWDIFNARTHRGGSELAQKYFQMQQYKQRQENTYRGIAMHAARVQQQAEQQGEYEHDILDPMAYQMMMMNGQNNIMSGAPNNQPVPHQGMASVGPQYTSGVSMQPSIQPQPMAPPPTSAGAIDLMVQPLGVAPPSGSMPPMFYDHQNPSPRHIANGMVPMLGNMVSSHPEQQMDGQSPMQRQSQQQTPKSALSPAAPLNISQQIHGGPMFRNQPIMYPYNVPGGVYPVQQQYVQSPAMTIPATAPTSVVTTPSAPQGASSALPQRKRKKSQQVHQHQQQFQFQQQQLQQVPSVPTNQLQQSQPGVQSQQQDQEQQEVERTYSNADGLNNYRQQLMLLERENKKAISTTLQEARSSSTKSIPSGQITHRLGHSMLPPSSHMSPQTHSSPSSAIGAQTIGSTTNNLMNSVGTVKKRKYARRKADQKKSHSEPNSPATPLTPFTTNSLTLSSTLSTVTEVPHHEAISSPSLNEEDRKRKRAKTSASAHPTPPISTESLIDTNSATALPPQKGYTTPSSLNPAKVRNTTEKTPASSTSSNDKKSSASSASSVKSPDININPIAPSSITNVPNAEELLSGANIETNPDGTEFSPSNAQDLNTLQNDPTLSGDVPFQLDHDDPDLLSTIKKPSSPRNSAALAVDDAAADLGSSAILSTSELANAKDQDAFNLDFSDPNSTYSDFNFFQFSWR